jgi:hypothetical protein
LAKSSTIVQDQFRLLVLGYSPEEARNEVIPHAHFSHLDGFDDNASQQIWTEFVKAFGGDNATPPRLPRADESVDAYILSFIGASEATLVERLTLPCAVSDGEGEPPAELEASIPFVVSAREVCGLPHDWWTPS